MKWNNGSLKFFIKSINSSVRLGLAVAHIPRAKRVAEGDALAGVLGRFPMGRDHPQGYTPNEVSREAGSSGLRLLDFQLRLKCQRDCATPFPSSLLPTLQRLVRVAAGVVGILGSVVSYDDSR